MFLQLVPFNLTDNYRWFVWLNILNCWQKHSIGYVISCHERDDRIGKNVINCKHNAKIRIYRKEVDFISWKIFWRLNVL